MGCDVEAEQDAERVLLAMATNLQSTGQFSALVVCNAGSMPPAAQAQYLQVFPRTEQAELGAMNRIFYTPFDTFAEREGAEATVANLQAQVEELNAINTKLIGHSNAKQKKMQALIKKEPIDLENE